MLATGQQILVLHGVVAAVAIQAMVAAYYYHRPASLMMSVHGVGGRRNTGCKVAGPLLHHTQVFGPRQPTLVGVGRVLH